MSILKKVAAFKRKAVKHTVNDTEFNFYPVRIGRLLSGEIQEAVGPLVKAVSTLMSSGETVKPEEHSQCEKDGTVYSKRNELTVEMASWVQASRGNAAKDAVCAVLDPKTKLVLARVLADSLRDDFDEDVTDEYLEEFMEALDVKDIAEFGVGFLKANAEVFGFDEENRTKAGNLLKGLLESVRQGSTTPLTVVPDPEETDDEIVEDGEIPEDQ